MVEECLTYVGTEGTFKFVEPFLPIIEENYLERQRVGQAKRRAKRKSEEVALGIRRKPTADRIVAFVSVEGNVSAEQVAKAIDLKVVAARRQLARLARPDGLLRRVSWGRYATKVMSHV